MAQLAMRRFSTPAALRQMAAEVLLALLQRQAPYFRTRGAPLPDVAADLDYDAVSAVLMAPNEETPIALIDDLHFISEMATPEGMDALLHAIAALPACEHAAFALPDDATPAEVAVRVRLTRPELLERTHAERQIYAKRSFDYFQSVAQDWSFLTPSPATIETLEAVLDSHFDELRRGRNTRVFVFERSDAVWMLIRHGEPCRREAGLQGTVSVGVHYRPERFDVLRYDPHSGQLAMNAESKRIGELYRREVGLHLFGSPVLFPVRERYTLEPLREHGERALLCSDFPEIEWIRLREIRCVRGGAEHETLVLSVANDLLAHLRNQGQELPARGKLQAGKFAIKFRAAKTPRMMTVATPITLKVTRDGDAALLEKWLERRGFVLAADDPRDARADAALGDA